MEKQNNKRKKERNSYIFPNFLAMAMKKAEMKTQLESSMLSMTLLLFGMILMGIYSAVYLTQGWVFKGLVIFNILAGFLFMSSYLVTTYQQYVSYLGAVEIQKQMNPELAQPPKKKNKLNQSLFFGGLIFFIASMILYFVYQVPYWIFLLSGVGIIMMTIPFFRKPINKIPSLVEDKTHILNQSIMNIPFKKLPDSNIDSQSVIKNKLTKDQMRQQFLKQKYDQKLEEMKLQNELDQQDKGFDTNPEDEIAQLEALEQQEDTPYVDYTQSSQPPKRYKGKDGRTYYV